MKSAVFEISKMKKLLLEHKDLNRDQLQELIDIEQSHLDGVRDDIKVANEWHNAELKKLSAYKESTKKRLSDLRTLYLIQYSETH